MIVDWWLGEYYIDTFLIHCQKVLLANLDVRFHLVYFGVVEEAAQLAATPIVGYHLDAGVNVGQFDGRTTCTCKSVQDDLSSCAFSSNKLRNLFWRCRAP